MVLGLRTSTDAFGVWGTQLHNNSPQAPLTTGRTQLFVSCQPPWCWLSSPLVCGDTQLSARPTLSPPHLWSFTLGSHLSPICLPPSLFPPLGLVTAGTGWDDSQSSGEVMMKHTGLAGVERCRKAPHPLQVLFQPVPVG